MKSAVTVSPNPLVVSRDVAVGGACAMELRNESINTVLFTLSFDGSLFSCISPACGELEPNTARTLRLVLEDLPQDTREVAFAVGYSVVLPGADESQKRKAMLNQEKWRHRVDVHIRFLSHEEESMMSFSGALRKDNRRGVEEAIEKREREDIEAAKIAKLREVIQQKEKEREMVEKKLEELTEVHRKQKEELDRYKNTRDWENSVLVFTFFLFVFSLLFRRIFRK